MTRHQAERAAGTRFLPGYSTGPTCVSGRFARTRAFLILNRGLVTRLEVARPGIRTTRGISVGDTEARVLAAYPGTRISPHPYVRGGHYLTYTRGHRRLIFETDGRRVTSMRGGRIPEVDFIEGCA